MKHAIKSTGVIVTTAVSQFFGLETPPHEMDSPRRRHQHFCVFVIHRLCPGIKVSQKKAVFPVCVSVVTATSAVAIGSINVTHPMRMMPSGLTTIVLSHFMEMMCK